MKRVGKGAKKGRAQKGGEGDGGYRRWLREVKGFGPRGQAL